MYRILSLAELKKWYLEGESGVFWDVEGITKGTGAIQTTLGADYLNKTYGMLVWSLLNKEANAFGMLPKTDFPRSGWRVEVALPTTYANIVFGEGDTLPSAVLPEYARMEADIKKAALPFEISKKMLLKSRSKDDAVVTVDRLRKEYAQNFVKLINMMIMRKYFGENFTDGSDCEDPSTTTNYILPLDRIVSSSAEASALQVAGREDVYGVDRSADSIYDSVVKYSSESGGQALTTDLILDALAEVWERGGRPNVMLTGAKTYAYLLSMYETLTRYAKTEMRYARGSVNGVQTPEGVDVGMKVMSIFGIPIITAVDTPVDRSSSNGLNRLYILDTSDPEGNGYPRLAISVAEPPRYYEIDNPLVNNKTTTRGIYTFFGEVVARNLRVQAKIRDIVKA